LVCARVCGQLGGSRFKASDRIDLAVGIVIRRHVGSRVNKGERQNLVCSILMTSVIIWLHCHAATGCPPVSHLIRERRLRFFGHVTRADPKQDQHRVIGASLRPPSHWRRPCGRSCTSWLRAIDTDVQSVNTGIQSARRKASDRTLWRRVVDTATLHHGAHHHFVTGGSEVWVYRGSRVRSPPVPVVLSVYQRGSLLDGLAVYLSCDTKKLHDNESTHTYYIIFGRPPIGGSFPLPPLAAPLVCWTR